MKRLVFALLVAGSVPSQAQDVQPADFAWRAEVDASPHQGLVRLPVPPQALARLQSASAADLRVFDERDRPVPFALATPPRPAAAPRERTAAFPALPLFTADGAARAPQGAVQVRIEESGQRRSVWVQLGDVAAPPAPAAHRLPAALFDTRGLQDNITALVVRGRLPANVPVRLTVSTSEDLASWNSVSVRGRLYRFEGEGAPANDTLELPAPLPLKGRYLRVDWTGQEGVGVDAVTGLLAAATPPVPRPALDLPAPQADGPAALVWQTGFATPMAVLELSTERPNTLVPLRVLGRNLPSEPWRTLGHTVLYRLGPAGQESTSMPLQLQRASARYLRVEATHGLRLEGIPLAARVLFDPLEVVFVAGDGGRHQLAAGRGDTPAAALPLGMLAGATATRVEALPAARITEARSVPEAGRPAWAAWLPPGTDTRTFSLWLVLAVGVLVLGAVAWSLLRQVDRTDKRGG